MNVDINYLNLFHEKIVMSKIAVILIIIELIEREFSNFIIQNH